LKIDPNQARHRPQTRHGEALEPVSKIDTGTAKRVQRRPRGDFPIIAINDRWRLADDGVIQWIIQRRAGKTWPGDKYLNVRKHLLTWLRRLELLTPEVEAQVMQLPEIHRYDPPPD
jgi:hypothetical protein